MCIVFVKFVFVVCVDCIYLSFDGLMGEDFKFVCLERFEKLIELLFNKGQCVLLVLDDKFVCK